MCQSASLYDLSPAVQLLDPWMRARLPKIIDETARRRLIQLTAGIFESHSALIETIATGTAFQANEISSNETQVRRILRDERIHLASTYYPFIRCLLEEMQSQVLYLTMDESSHKTDFCIYSIGLATDGGSIPLGWMLYDTDATWAEDARDLLQELAHYLPEQTQIIVLADRIHTGEPFLACLDALGWDYIFRANSATLVETSRGCKELRTLALRNNTGRFFQHVRIWKGGHRRTNVSMYKLARKGFRTVTWYVVSSVPAKQERFVEYACRWWQECGFKSLKSALFDWERGRVTEPARVEVLLIGIGCALWAMWLLGRAHEHVPKRKSTTTKPQQRRKSIIKQGSTVFKHASKKKRSLIIPTPPMPRVLDYERMFGQLAQNHVMQ